MASLPKHIMLSSEERLETRLFRPKQPAPRRSSESNT
jgi:hypothetical protein